MRDKLDTPADLPRESSHRIKTERAWVLRKLGSWCCWMGVVLVVYVLSAGPVVKFSIKGPIPEQMVETVYAPIKWLADTKAGEKIVWPFIEWYGYKIWGWGPSF